MNRSSHPGRFQTVIFRFRLGELGLAEVQKVASSRGLTEASIFRMGLALALDEVARRPVSEVASGLEIDGASSPDTVELLAHRSAVVKLRIHPRERTRLATAALAHQVAEASLMRLGVTLVLAALRRDPRHRDWQHGFPAELRNRMPPTPGARAARGAGQLVRADGTPRFGVRAVDPRSRTTTGAPRRDGAAGADDPDDDKP